MAMTTQLANQIANVTVRNGTYTTPGNVYAALYTTVLSATGTGTEVVGNGYSRQLTTFTSPVDSTVESTGNVTFTCSGNAWPLVQAFAIVDASTGGNMMYYKNISARNVKPGDTVIFDAGDISITIG